MKGEPYTARDDAIIREMWTTHSVAQIGDRLGRTASSIYSRAWTHMRLSRPRKPAPPRDRRFKGRCEYRGCKEFGIEPMLWRTVDANELTGVSGHNGAGYFEVTLPRVRFLEGPQPL